MSSYLPKEPKDTSKPSPTRIAIWVFVGLVGLSSVIAGIIGVIQHG